MTTFLPRLCLAFLLAASVAHAAPWPRHTIDASSADEGKLGADGVRLADANEDGLPDIVTGWENGDAIRVCLNPGPAKAKLPWPAVTVGRVAGAEDAVFADLDADGNLDVLTSTEGKTKTLFVHWAPSDRGDYLDAGAWRTEPIPGSQSKQSWMFALPLDVDGAYGIDFITGSKGANASMSWFESPGDPRKLEEWKIHPMHPASWVMSIRSADIDRDGDTDILYSDRKADESGIYWLENPGEAPPGALRAPWRRHLLGAGGLEVMFLDVADLDGDGFDEIVAAVKDRDIVILSRETPDSDDWLEDYLPMPPEGTAGTGKAVRAGDLNGDGVPDLALTCEHANGELSGAHWIAGPLAGRSPADWHDISGPEGVKYDRIELLDLDADGDLDLLTCEERDNLGVFWFENPGP